MSKDSKQLAAKHSLQFIEKGMVVGVGTGSTVDQLIPLLQQIEGCQFVASSVKTEQALLAQGSPVLSLNDVSGIDLYIDGTDAIDDDFLLLKGGGGAMTQEKILATHARLFVVIADHSKQKSQFSDLPCPIEVLDVARSQVARTMRAMGAHPEYRFGFQTDHGNRILDVFGLDFAKPVWLENQIKQIPGVVESGLFAKRRPEFTIIAKEDQVQLLKRSQTQAGESHS